MLEIFISDTNLEIIKSEGKKSYPDECCGLLIGKVEDDRKIITQVIPTVNDWENQKELFSHFNDRHDRQCRDTFSIDPITILKVQKQAREEDLAIVGIYHSHPDHPAIPSAFDTEFAWQIYSYIIISVTEQGVVSARSWILDRNNDDNTKTFQEEKIVISVNSKQ